MQESNENSKPTPTSQEEESREPQARDREKVAQVEGIGLLDVGDHRQTHRCSQVDGPVKPVEETQSFMLALFDYLPMKLPWRLSW